jgi:hypothetical protein
MTVNADVSKIEGRPCAVLGRSGSADAKGSPDAGRSFAVIGAGAAGLCAAKHLVQSGFEDVTIFELGTQIGGLWCYENDNGRSSCYRTLHINTARNLTNFSDFPFAPEIQLFPDHWDMHRYLLAFAERFDLVKRIEFRSEVTDLKPAADSRPDRARWELTFKDGRRRVFDRAIVATGHLSVPLHVEQFRRDFTGQYLHAHDYREPNGFVGKRVCVVGVGNSACDIVADVCATSPGTTLVARSGVMIVPKLIFGIPFTDLSMKLHRKWIPEWLRQKLTAFLVHLIHGRMTTLGFRPLTRRAHPTTNAVIVMHIAYRRVTVKHEIVRIEGKRLFFSDGTSAEFDVLIGATGYLIDLPFVSPEIVPVVGNAIDLYKRIVPPAWKGLYFMGFFNTNTALNLVFERQARWIIALESGKAHLPDEAAMREAIDRKKAFIARFYKDSPRHTIEEEHLHYLGELAQPY